MPPWTRDRARKDAGGSSSSINRHGALAKDSPTETGPSKLLVGERQKSACGRRRENGGTGQSTRVRRPFRKSPRHSRALRPGEGLILPQNTVLKDTDTGLRRGEGRSPGEEGHAQSEALGGLELPGSPRRKKPRAAQAYLHFCAHSTQSRPSKGLAPKQAALH